MARFIDADELKKHIRWDLLHYGGKYTVTDCEAIDRVIDSEEEIILSERDKGAEPLLEEKTSFYDEVRADGTGGIKSSTHTDWMCPQCGWFVGELYSGHGRWHIQQDVSFCARCGQRIDWTKPKEEEKRKYEEQKKREREEWERKTGHRLDNMYEHRRIKYGVTSKEQ